MRRGWGRLAVLAAVGVLLATNLPAGHAFHFYRSTDDGCSAAEGGLTDDPSGTIPNVVASVAVGHNAFARGIAGTGFNARTLLAPLETHIKAGQSITWTWQSAHCHSVTSNAFASGTTRLFDSGFHYPTTAPESPRAVPGFFEYPILDDTPTLSYTHTFTAPGTYEYFCVHHSSIGMNGVVVVEP
jgi:plastocyanin